MMADIFYYIGFGYITYLIYGIAITIFDNGKESKKVFGEIKNSMPKDITDINMQGSLTQIVSTTVSPMVSPIKEQAKKHRLGTIFSVLFFVWLITGAFRTQQDSGFFVFLLIQILSYQLFIISMLIINAFKRKNEFIITSILNEADGASQSKTTTIIHIALEIIKITIISFIIYNHFIV